MCIMRDVMRIPQQGGALSLYTGLQMDDKEPLGELGLSRLLVALMVHAHRWLGRAQRVVTDAHAIPETSVQQKGHMCEDGVACVLVRQSVPVAVVRVGKHFQSFNAQSNRQCTLISLSTHTR